MPKIYGYTEILGDILVTGSFSVLGSASTINTTNLVVSDTIISLGHSQSGSPTLDEGLMFGRGTGLTQAIIWDETNDTFALIGTNDDHTVIGSININSYSNLRTGGLTTSDITITNGASNGYYLQSDATGHASWSALPGGLTGSGTTNYVPYWTNSNTLSSTSSIYISSENIGINSNTPTAQLYLKTNNGLNTEYGFKIENNVGGNLLKISKLGRIGISSGVSGDPSHDIEVNSVSATNLIYAENSNNIVDAIVRVKTTGTGDSMNSQFVSENSTGNTLKVVSFGASYSLYPEFANNQALVYTNDLLFNNSNTTRAALTSAGNFGIGTASPIYKLQVLGTVSTTGFRMTDGAQNGYVLTSNSNGVASWSASNNIYSSDGSVLSPRTVTIDNQIIYFSGTDISGTLMEIQLDNQSNVGYLQYTDTLGNIHGLGVGSSGTYLSSTNGITTAQLNTSTSGVRVNNSYYLPTTDGLSGQFITTDGSGNLSFTTASTANFANTDLTFTGNRTHDTNGNSFEITTDGGGFSAGFIYFNNTLKSEFGFGSSYTDWRTASVDHYLSGVKRLEILSTETVFNNPGGNYDFRIEGVSDQNLFTVNASRNNVGIGISTAFLDSNSGTKLLITNSNATSSTNQGVVVLVSGASYSYGSSVAIGSSISSNLGDIGYASSITSVSTAASNSYTFYANNTSTTSTKFGYYAILSGNGKSDVNYGLYSNVSGANITNFGERFAVSGTASTNYGSYIVVTQGINSNTGLYLNLGSGANTVTGTELQINAGDDYTYGNLIYLTGTQSSQRKVGTQISVTDSNNTSTHNFGVVSLSNSGYKNTGGYFVVGSGFGLPNSDVALHARVSNTLTSSQSQTHGIYISNEDDRSSSTSYGIESSVTSNSTTNYGIYVNVINGTTNYGLLVNKGTSVFNESGDSTTDFRIEGSTNQNLFFVDASADNIGIGTNTPSYRLQVSGTVSTTGFRMTNGASNGYVLMSDSTGSGSWTASHRTTMFRNGSFNPLDATTYYIGDIGDLGPVTTEQISRRIKNQFKGEIISVSIMCYISGTLGTSENVTYQIHNITAATSQTITSTAQLTGDFLTTYTLSSPLAVSVDDEIQIRMVCPTWVTNPTTVRQHFTTKIRVY